MENRIAKQKASRRRRGFTLVEIAMVLAIGIVLIAGALLLYQNASTNSKITEAGTQVANVSQAVRSIYAGQASYNGLANTMISTALPRKMVKDATGATLVNAFNGGVAVAAAQPASGLADSAFTVSMSNIPSEGCLALATKDFGRAVIGLKVNATDAVKITATPAEAKAACTDQNNTLIWTMF